MDYRKELQHIVDKAASLSSIINFIYEQEEETTQDVITNNALQDFLEKMEGIDITPTPPEMETDGFIDEALPLGGNTIAAGATALREFLHITCIRKQDFAQKYGCTPSFISHILANKKPINLQKFANIVGEYGYTLNYQRNKKKYKLMKK